MHGYVDPFAHRSTRSMSVDDDLDAVSADTSSDDASPDVENEDPDQGYAGDIEGIGLDAITDDAERGRREAPFADDPAHVVGARAMRREGT